MTAAGFLQVEGTVGLTVSDVADFQQTWETNRDSMAQVLADGIASSIDGVESSSVNVVDVRIVTSRRLSQDAAPMLRRLQSGTQGQVVVDYIIHIPAQQALDNSVNVTSIKSNLNSNVATQLVTALQSNAAVLGRSFNGFTVLAVDVSDPAQTIVTLVELPTTTTTTTTEEPAAGSSPPPSLVVTEDPPVEAASVVLIGSIVVGILLVGVVAAVIARFCCWKKRPAAQATAARAAEEVDPETVDTPPSPRQEQGATVWQLDTGTSPAWIHGQEEEVVIRIPEEGHVGEGQSGSPLREMATAQPRSMWRQDVEIAPNVGLGDMLRNYVEDEQVVPILPDDCQVEYWSKTHKRWLPGQLEVIKSPGSLVDMPKVTYNIKVGKQGERKTQVREDVHIDSFRLPLQEGETVEIFSHSRGGRWMQAAMEGTQVTAAVSGYRIKLFTEGGPEGCSGAAAQVFDKVPPVRLRRAFQPGVQVKLYKGPNIGWKLAVIDPQAAAGYDRAMLDSWMGIDAGSDAGSDAASVASGASAASSWLDGVPVEGAMDSGASVLGGGEPAPVDSNEGSSSPRAEALPWCLVPVREVDKAEGAMVPSYLVHPLDIMSA